ncbi:hypothetical protein CBM2589_B150061 [Cupriavidus taiwanensis]|uniref:Uncharacterized protein n=1 Tax=Cupriavidus taiwanensis TaxID=164546 RepID=A0A975WWJ2_9BURK|nr:hypothetical protein CBM2589_B150061 [Cupriavidus taiwanensis]
MSLTAARVLAAVRCAPLVIDCCFLRASRFDGSAHEGARDSNLLSRLAWGSAGGGADNRTPRPFE